MNDNNSNKLKSVGIDGEILDEILDNGFSEIECPYCKKKNVQMISCEEANLITTSSSEVVCPDCLKTYVLYWTGREKYNVDLSIEDFDLPF